MKNFSKFIIFVMLAVCISNTIYAKNSDLLNLIKGNAFLEDGNIEFIILNEDKFCVSVGASIIQGKSAASKIKAMKEARIIAEEQLMKFIHSVQVSSKEVLESTTETRQTGTGINTREVRESYLELIRERGQGILRNIISIGKWKNKDKTEYFFGVGIKITEN